MQLGKHLLISVKGLIVELRAIQQQRGLKKTPSIEFCNTIFLGGTCAGEQNGDWTVESGRSRSVLPTWNAREVPTFLLEKELHLT